MTPMTEIALTKIRRTILEACSSSHGVLDNKWVRDALAQKAVNFLIAQWLLERRLGDGQRAMAYRLHITERGRAALRGDILTKV